MSDNIGDFDPPKKRKSPPEKPSALPDSHANRKRKTPSQAEAVAEAKREETINAAQSAISGDRLSSAVQPAISAKRLSLLSRVKIGSSVIVHDRGELEFVYVMTLRANLLLIFNVELL